MLADHFDAFLLDLDGVLHVGPDPLPDAVDAVARLRRSGKALRFLTNDPRPTRAEVAQRLTRMGMEADIAEIVTAASATAAHLQKRAVATAYVVGSRGLREELRGADVEFVAQGQPEVVVVGCDESVRYSDLRQAVTLITRGSRFIATNPDPTFPTPDGPWPATGAILAAVTAATGVRPRVIGKPSPPMFEAALIGLPRGARAAVVGDSADTDVLGAHQAGLTAILIAPEAPSNVQGGDPRTPDATITTMAGLFSPREPLHRPLRLTFPWPQEIRPGVAAVVLDERGDVLLVRRADNGLWGLPSGHVELGETIAHAAVREVLEETGLQVRVSRLVGVYSEPESQVVAYLDGRVCQFITASFACTPVGGALRPDGVEAVAARFFPVGEMPTDLLRMHPQWLADALDGLIGAYR